MKPFLAAVAALVVCTTASASDRGHDDRGRDRELAQLKADLAATRAALQATQADLAALETAVASLRATVAANASSALGGALTFDTSGGQAVVNVNAAELRFRGDGAITAPNDLSITVGRSLTELVGGARSTSVGGNAAVAIGGSLSTTVGVDATTSVGRNASSDVNGNRSDRVAGNHQESVGIAYRVDAASDVTFSGARLQVSTSTVQVDSAVTRSSGVVMADFLLAPAASIGGVTFP